MTAEATKIVAAFREKTKDTDYEKVCNEHQFSFYYDKDGSRLTLFEWAALFEDKNYRIVARDDIPPHGYLSTIWLGLDHRWGGDGSPVIFETMLFLPPTTNGIQQRYCTLEGALEGHADLLRRARGNVLEFMEEDDETE